MATVNPTATAQGMPVTGLGAVAVAPHSIKSAPRANEIPVVNILVWFSLNSYLLEGHFQFLSLAQKERLDYSKQNIR